MAVTMIAKPAECAIIVIIIAIKRLSIQPERMDAHVDL